jgi:hypothetical protein
MKYAVQMGSGAMIYVNTKFYKDWSSHSKVEGGDTQRVWRSHKPIFIFEPTFVF